MYLQNIFRLFCLALLIFIFVLLVQGFFQYYEYKISFYISGIPIDKITISDDGDFSKLIWWENGIVEILQVIFLFVSILLLINCLNKHSSIKKNIINKIIIIYIIGLLYFLLEEISWGQHIFHYETFGIFNEINQQKEVNLHNIANLFNQWPKYFIFYWCSLSILSIEFLKKKININKQIIVFVKPDKRLLIISYILIFFLLPDLIIDRFSFPMGEHEYSNTIIWSEINDLISFNFIRLSELHELFFCIYFFWHAIFLKKNYLK